MRVLKEGALSMAKEISYDNETREKLAAGVAKLADTVRVTIGPKGRYVGVTKEGERHPYVSNDGATVAAHVGSRDRVEKMGLQVVREAATAANNEAGDGTSTATLLADAIVREGVRYVTAGNDPLALRRGIQKAADVASDALLKSATQVTTREQKSPPCPRATRKSATPSPRRSTKSGRTASSPLRSPRSSASAWT